MKNVGAVIYGACCYLLRSGGQIHLLLTFKETHGDQQMQNKHRWSICYWCLKLDRHKYTVPSLKWWHESLLLLKDKWCHQTKHKAWVAILLLKLIEGGGCAGGWKYVCERNIFQHKEKVFVMPCWLLINLEQRWSPQYYNSFLYF